MFKKIMALVLVMALTAAVAIGGTVAYLTDRDSEANVFTVGDVSIELNEKFQQGAELVPGVNIEKEATITNTGKNDAWVWLTVLLPKEMGPYTAPGNMSASNNVVHWNYPAESAANITVDFNSTPVAIDTDGDGATESYYQTNMLWKNTLAAGETTGIMLNKVYMDKHVDIDPDGNMYWVADGVATDLNWNVNEKGNPVIHVSAYAVQEEGFADVNAAYAAYQTQWGDNGAEYAAVAESDTTWYDDTAANFTLNTADDLLGFAELVAGGNSFSGKTVTLGADINLAGVTWTPVGQTGATQFLGTFDGNSHTIKNLSVNSSAQTEAHYSSGLFGWLNAATVKNLTVEGATIIGNHNVGVIAGYMESSGCTISNCHVVNATVICNHANDDACGDKAGVIVGHAGNAGVKVENCSAKNSTVKAGRDAGQVAGAALTANVTGCTATNVNVTAAEGCTGANINNAVIGRVLG